ncbi:hypothetical protein SteCoe_12940 [Stentor coeruleus]|uniref:Uncharacterized protein n=1 Tax=Stentor coeruleus TaxID=5963 RepID=A0A1R2C9K2_9CILI|nr:hypothetical protein SteCoe_12940 [Stentor coeruleus]
MDNEIKAAIQIQKIIRGFLIRQRLYALYPKYLNFASKKILKNQNFLEDRFTIITNFSKSNKEIKAKSENSENLSEKNKIDPEPNFNPKINPENKHEKQEIIEDSYEIYSESKTTIGILILKTYKEIVKPLSDLEIIKQENYLEEYSKSYSGEYEKSLDKNSNSQNDEHDKISDIGNHNKSSEGLIVKKLSESSIENIEKDEEEEEEGNKDNSEEEEDLKKINDKSNSLKKSKDEIEVESGEEKSSSLDGSIGFKNEDEENKEKVEGNNEEEKVEGNNEEEKVEGNNEEEKVEIKNYDEENEENAEGNSEEEKVEIKNYDEENVENKSDEESSEEENEVKNKVSNLENHNEMSKLMNDSGEEDSFENEGNIGNKDKDSEGKNEDIVMDKKEIIVNKDENIEKSNEKNEDIVMDKKETIVNKNENIEKSTEKVEGGVMSEKEKDFVNEKVIENKDENKEVAEISVASEKENNKEVSEISVTSEKENNKEVAEISVVSEKENDKIIKKDDAIEKSIEKDEDKLLGDKENEAKLPEITTNKNDDIEKKIVKKVSIKNEKSFEEIKNNEKSPNKESSANQSLVSEKGQQKPRKLSKGKKDEKPDLIFNSDQSNLNKKTPEHLKSEKDSSLNQSSISGSSNPAFKPKPERSDPASISHLQSIKKKKSNIPKKKLDNSKDSISKTKPKPNEKILETNPKEKNSSDKDSHISKKQETKPQIKEETKSINNSIISHKSTENNKSKTQEQEDKNPDLENQAKILALLSSEAKNLKLNLSKNPLSGPNSQQRPSLLSLPKPTDTFINPLLPDIDNKTPPVKNTPSFPQIITSSFTESKPQDHENLDSSSPFPMPVEDKSMEKSEVLYEKPSNSSYKENKISIKTPSHSSSSSFDSPKSLKRLESDKTQKNSTPKSKRPSGSFAESIDKKANEESKRLSQQSQGSYNNKHTENSLEIKNELRVHESLKSESSDKTMKFDGKIEKFSPDFKGKLSHSSSFSKSSYKESQKSAEFLKDNERSYENIAKNSEDFYDFEKDYKQSDSDDDKDLESNIYIKQQTDFANMNIETNDFGNDIRIHERNSMEIQNFLPYIESPSSPHPHQNFEIKNKNKKSKTEFKPSEKPQVIKNTRKKLSDSKYTPESKSHSILPSFIPSKTSEKFEIPHKNDHIAPTSYSKTTSFAPSQLSHLPIIGKDDANKASNNFPIIPTKKNQANKQESKIKLNKIIQLSGRAETKSKKAEKIDKNLVFDIKPPVKRASSKQNFKISPRTPDDIGKAFHVVEKHVEVAQKNPYDVGWSQKLFKKFFNLNIKIDQSAASLPKLKLIKIRRDNIKNLLKNNK